MDDDSLELLANIRFVKKPIIVKPIKEKRLISENDEIIELLHERLKLEKNKYGISIKRNTIDNRGNLDWELKALEEMLDGLIYTATTIIRYRQKKNKEGKTDSNEIISDSNEIISDSTEIVSDSNEIVSDSNEIVSDTHMSNCNNPNIKKELTHDTIIPNNININNTTNIQKELRPRISQNQVLNTSNIKIIKHKH